MYAAHLKTSLCPRSAHSCDCTLSKAFIYTMQIRRNHVSKGSSMQGRRNVVRARAMDWSQVGSSLRRKVVKRPSNSVKHGKPSPQKRRNASTRNSMPLSITSSTLSFAAPVHRAKYNHSISMKAPFFQACNHHSFSLSQGLVCIFHLS